METKKEDSIPNIWVILLIIIIIIIVIATLGRINPNNLRVPEEFKDTSAEAKRKHKRLQDFINKQTALKIKLEKKFRIIYFFVRFGLIALWCAFISIFYFTKQIHNLGDALNYSEASLLVIFALNFLTFGTLTSLKVFIDLVKTKTENWVYGKYLTLDQKIEANKTELNQLEIEINQVKNN